MFLVNETVFSAYYTIKYITDIPHNPTGQAVIEKSNFILTKILNKKNDIIMTPNKRLENNLFTLNYLNAIGRGTTTTEKH